MCIVWLFPLALIVTNEEFELPDDGHNCADSLDNPKEYAGEECSEHDPQQVCVAIAVVRQRLISAID